MNLYGDLYDGKLEQKYFYLPKICKKNNNYFNDLYNNSNNSNSNVSNKIIIYLFFIT